MGTSRCTACFICAGAHVHLHRGWGAAENRRSRRPPRMVKKLKRRENL
jgi:hypothetical protein